MACIFLICIFFNLKKLFFIKRKQLEIQYLNMVADDIEIDLKEIHAFKTDLLARRKR